MADNFYESSVIVKRKLPTDTDMTLADVRMRKIAADRGPEGEARKDTAAGPVRNVAGPASDAARKAAIAARMKEKEPVAAKAVVVKPAADPANPTPGGATVTGAYENLKRRQGRNKYAIDQQTQ